MSSDTTKIIGIIFLVAILNFATIFIIQPGPAVQPVPEVLPTPVIEPEVELLPPAFGPGIATNDSVGLTLYVAETPTVGGDFRVCYNITNFGPETVWMDIPARGKNFNIHILTPDNTQIMIIPLIDSMIIDGPVNPGSSFSGYINLVNNEYQIWGEPGAIEGYEFPAGTYSAYADYKNGEAYSLLITFEIPEE